jgi:hypothetical protein
MTDIEMKDDKASPATEVKKPEEPEEPQDHFYGNLFLTPNLIRA